MIRITAYLAPALLLSALLLAAAWLHIARELGGEILNNDLEGKICALQSRFGSPGILIAGDSRAHWQLIPSRFEAGSGLTALNVSVNGGDPTLLRNAIGKYPGLVSKAKLLIVTVGIYQVNDGVLDPGPMGPAEFLALGPADHLRLFWKRPRLLLGRYWKLARLYATRNLQGIRFECGDHWAPGYDVYATKGFLEKVPVWDKVVSREELLADTWFRGVRIDGVRWKQFASALAALGKLGPKLVIVESPFAPAWRHCPAASPLVSAELAFGRKLKGLADGLGNAEFLDLFSDDSGAFPDSLFYDAAHLNARGAVVFTDRVLRELEARKVLPALPAPPALPVPSGSAPGFVPALTDRVPELQQDPVR